MHHSDHSDDRYTALIKCRAALGDVEAIDYLKQHRLPEANACGMELEEANLCLKDAFREYNMVDVVLKDLPLNHASLKDIPDLVEKLKLFQDNKIPLPQDTIVELEQIQEVFTGIGREFGNITAEDFKKQQQPHKTLEEQAELACAAINAQISLLLHTEAALTAKGK